MGGVTDEGGDGGEDGDDNVDDDEDCDDGDESWTQANWLEAHCRID